MHTVHDSALRAPGKVADQTFSVEANNADGSSEASRQAWRVARRCAECAAAVATAVGLIAFCMAAGPTEIGIVSAAISSIHAGFSVPTTTDARAATSGLSEARDGFKICSYDALAKLGDMGDGTGIRPSSLLHRRR